MIKLLKSDPLGWIGTFSIMIATIIRATGYSNLLDLMFTGFGCALLAYTTYGKSAALFTVNAFSVFIIALGIGKHFF